MALSRLQWGMITAGILIIMGLVLVYYFVLMPKPKVVNGAQTIFTVDQLGNVYDAQNLYVGRDNGNDSWTSTTGAIYDYNGNVLTAAPAGGTAAAAVTPNAGAVTQQVAAPASPTYNLLSLI